MIFILSSYGFCSGRVRGGGAKQGRFVIVLFSLFYSTWGSQDAGKKQHEKCPCNSPFYAIQMLVKNQDFRADFWEGDATKHFSVKKGIFSEKGGGNSVNQGFGKDFYRKGNSVKRFGPFTEPPDSEN